MIIGSGFLLLPVQIADGAGAAVAGCAGTTSVLDKGTNGFGRPLVHPPEDSDPNVLGRLDTRNFCKHFSNENHGSLAIPAAFLGPLYLLCEETDKSQACLTLWGIV